MILDQNHGPKQLQNFPSLTHNFPLALNTDSISTNAKKSKKSQKDKIPKTKRRAKSDQTLAEKNPRANLDPLSAHANFMNLSSYDMQQAMAQFAMTNSGTSGIPPYYNQGLLI